MNTAATRYRQVLKNRRQGVMSDLGPEASWLEIKPEFYADSRVLSENALEVFESFRKTHPPFGLVDARGNAITTFSSGHRPWPQLMLALKNTAHASFEQAVPSLTSCPYHTVLAEKLAPTGPPLQSYDYDVQGLDTLRNVVTPGGELNAPLFASLLRRLPAIQQLHGNATDPELFARNSVSLLREPMAHPQQWAKAFVYSLGTLFELLTPQFLNDDLAAEYTKVEPAPARGDRLAWAMPTADFILRMEVMVESRTLGSERHPDAANTRFYPVGTRLGDIVVDEPTLGCPGNQLAAAMWHRTIDVIVGEDLWQTAG